MLNHPQQATSTCPQLHSISAGAGELNRLTYPLLIRIMTYLQPLEIVHQRLVCRIFNQSSNDSCAWRQTTAANSNWLCQSPFNQDYICIEILRIQPAVKYVDLKHLTAKLPCLLILQVFLRLSTLQHVVIDWSRGDVKYHARIAAAISELQKLHTLQICNVDNLKESDMRVICNSPAIQCLTLAAIEGYGNPPEIPTLHSVLAQIKHMASLRQLHILGVLFINHRSMHCLLFRISLR